MGRSADRRREGSPLAAGEVHVASRLLGDLQVSPDRVLEFPQGIAGFPDRRRFARVAARPGSAFEHLVSLDDPELAFAVADPTRLVPGYAPPVAEAAAALGARAEGVEFLAFLVVPEDVRAMTIDLGAPIAIDRSRRIACQLLVADPEPRAPVPVLRSGR